MSFKIIFSPKVYDDLQEAVDFYNTRNKGLGARFIKKIKIRISYIKSNTYGYQVRYNEIRCAPVDSFPYTIHYKVIAEINTIIIVAVLCDYRDPTLWETRL